MKKVLVMKGGVSSEREVSLESGAAVGAALRKGPYEVREYDVKSFELTPEMTEWADVVFPVLHGGEGEGGGLQELLEKASLRFVGSGSKSCRLIMNKILAKKKMDEYGIPNARYTVVHDKESPVPEGFSFPLIVKPPAEGSTFGVSLVKNHEEWQKSLELAFRYGKEVLVEAFFKGVETTVGVVDGVPLPVIEIRYAGEIYDYDAKYEHKYGETQYIVPPTGIPLSLQKVLQDAAVKFYRVCDARDILRIDIMANVETEEICVLEGNTIPGCTASSLVPKAARAAGISFETLCSNLVEAAWMR